MLGAWSRAYTIQMLFSQNINASIERVVHTTLCNLRNDRERFREVARRSFETLLILNCFAAVCMYFLAPELVRAGLGPGWDLVVPMITVLAVAVPTAAFTSIGYSTCVAKGNQKWIPVAAISRASIFIPILLLLPATSSVTTLAWIATASRWFVSLFLTFAGWRIAGMPPPQTFRRILVIALATAAAGFAIHFLKLELLSHGTLLRLIACTLAGAAVYFPLCFLLGGDMLTYILRASRGAR
jgi:O-antigen/teichoic acid export membrane protein